jgi:hypothetical protein
MMIVIFSMKYSAPETAKTLPSSNGGMDIFLACVREEFGILHENPGFSANLAGVCFLS